MTPQKPEAHGPIWVCPVCEAILTDPDHRRHRKRKKAPLITVCDACLTEACWQGTVMCENAKQAGTTRIPGETY